MHTDVRRDTRTVTPALTAEAHRTPIIRVLGCRVRPLERVAAMGKILGLGSRTTAYRLSDADDWPLIGPPSSRWVLVIQLLERYGIPYTVESADVASDEARDGDE